jgi:hypothetical protein
MRTLVTIEIPLGGVMKDGRRVTTKLIVGEKFKRLNGAVGALRTNPSVESHLPELQPTRSRSLYRDGCKIRPGPLSRSLDSQPSLALWVP